VIRQPSPRGSIVSFYGTGLGQMISQLPDGALAIATPYSTPVNPPTLTIEGQPATIVYAGDAPGFPTGVFQINATVLRLKAAAQALDAIGAFLAERLQAHASP
jgi:uncharacterized protein (TIGR03437 family)